MVEEGKIDSVPDQMTIYRTDINWLGFNKDYTIESGEAKAGFNNYYLPSCPEGAMNVKSYTDVTFKNLYAGVDVKWYEKNGELEYDFIVAPNKDYTKIAWEIQGAEKISIGEDGQLIIKTPLGEIEEQAPIAFQGDKSVEAAWKIDGNKISFQLGSYNENESLTIDPVVRLWGTYYGGTQNDDSYSCATDANGNVYLSGGTISSDGIATAGAHQTIFGGNPFEDAFLVKFNSSGVRQWGTYYGGSQTEFGQSCATDANGNVYLSGSTNSYDGIATAGAHQTIFGGDSVTDAFLVKFNSSGVRQWGTYYGEAEEDYGYSCATDANGNVYLTGQTQSTTGIATAGAHQTILGGNQDAFLVKFGASGVRQWGTYYGEAEEDYGYSCATDANGNVYLTGYTSSSDGIATAGAHQTILGGIQDAFLVKFDAGCTETYSEDTVTACDSYTWIDGVTYTSNNNTATDTLIASNGCDSIVSLNLTINDTKTSTDTVVANDSSYTWIDGVTYTSSNNTATDTLIASNGCDSIVTLNLTLILGLNNLATSSNIKVYPNPTNGKLTIDSKNFEGVEVYDVSGRLINMSELNTIDLEGQSKGLYLLKINANGTTQEFKVLKE